MRKTKPSALLLRPEVTLRPLTSSDAERMYSWVCDPNVSRNIGLTREPTLKQTEAWITKAESDPSVHAQAVLFNGQHVGNFIVDQIDSFHGTGRMSIYIGDPEMRGTGIGLTSLYLGLKNSFQECGLHKIWLIVHQNNERAIRTYDTLGFAREGVHRQEFRLGDSWIDTLYMGLLHDEFDQIPTKRPQKDN